MELRQIIEDDNAVSPVIGVILMVAITVILAAVIATFVLGLGDSISNTAPQASFSAELEGSDQLTFSHTGGASLDPANVYIRGDTSDSGQWDGDTSDSEIKAGNSATVTVTNPDSSPTVRVIWESSNSGQSATLYTWEG